MAMKIDANIEEIKSWVSEEDVCDVLTAFELIERNDHKMAKKVQITETIVCDICGKPAHGEYNSITYCNGDIVAEMSCPHDLCYECMEEWQYLCEAQAVERYDSLSEEKKERYLHEFKQELNTFKNGNS
ncbi:hypothetical protein [Enterococcus malodoratus]|uniref:hypothetical protein n=1 Tax=Enterococcus malodoratus TaxID=71451 RepID=UPI0022E787AE|nr:hypothetical protein [Enterococcus malodoratus]